MFSILHAKKGFWDLSIFGRALRKFSPWRDKEGKGGGERIPDRGGPRAKLGDSRGSGNQNRRAILRNWLPVGQKFEARISELLLGM